MICGVSYGVSRHIKQGAMNVRCTRSHSKWLTEALHGLHAMDCSYARNPLQCVSLNHRDNRTRMFANFNQLNSNWLSNEKDGFSDVVRARDCIKALKCHCPAGHF